MQAHGKGAEYQFHGFVIENVNDSLTMAKAGVWADHIQVQKLSQKLQRPLELFTFDDVALRMDRQGKYVPFPLSRFASFRFRSVSCGSRSCPHLSGCVPARTT